MIKITASMGERFNSCSLFDLENLVELGIETRGTGDIYIYGRTYGYKEIYDRTPIVTFIIKKDQPELYELFDKVYNTIMEKGSFTNYEEGLQHDVENQEIIISSEDAPINTCNKFAIRKLIDGFEINIINNNIEENFPQICFVGSGSRQPKASLFGTFSSLLYEFSKMADQNVDEYECRKTLLERSKVKIMQK
jgi:hypothetical protein